jgi:hypothetical protein
VIFWFHKYSLLRVKLPITHVFIWMSGCMFYFTPPWQNSGQLGSVSCTVRWQLCLMSCTWHHECMFCCFWECNRNSGHRFLYNWLLKNLSSLLSACTHSQSHSRGVIATSHCLTWWRWRSDTLWVTLTRDDHSLSMFILVWQELTQCLSSRCHCGVFSAISFIIYLCMTVCAF